MGSSGSGSFSDYPKMPSKGSERNGGTSGVDNCGVAISTSLEDVSRSLYFKSSGDLPPNGTTINVEFNGTRMAVVAENGQELGYLPTRYNYVRLCMNDGWKYPGAVASSSSSPVPSVIVDITPTK
jgi:hypothetical protein